LRFWGVLMLGPGCRRAAALVSSGILMTKADRSIPMYDLKLKSTKLGSK
jgi:hypothetical protein